MDISPTAAAAFRNGSDQDDDVFDEDMEALRRACMATGRVPGESEECEGEYAGDEGSDSDDVDLLRKIQERFTTTPIPEGGDHEHLVVQPLRACFVSDEEDDDFETLRAIQRRFQQYQDDFQQKNHDLCVNEAESVSSGSEAVVPDSSPEKQESQPSVGHELPSTSQTRLEDKFRDFNHWNKKPDGSLKFSTTPHNFSKSCRLFVDALKKNRTYQKFIRNKMLQIEGKIEENKDLRERTRCLIDLQSACKRRTGRLLSQKKDPRVRLISLPMSKLGKAKIVAEYGPAENSHVSNYKKILTRFPISMKKQRWMGSEDEKLAKGIKQQYQEMLMLSSMELDGPCGPSGSRESDMPCVPSLDFDIASESIREFLPLINWDRLASMYFTGRTGVECEARWLNSADPLINKSPWTVSEDKNILLIAQSRGVFNWIDIAVRLATHRTPFQCLSRYQRSLNAYILKKDWTEEEDAQLCSAVETYGEDWQLVASSLEGRTGPQCSNRWRKTLHPDRKRVGRWSVEEDKRLKVAVLLFGAKNWNKIAWFAPGRTQSQCRERWVNCLDPSLNLEPWTKEEDSKLIAAIGEFGYCWSKVATFIPPRTDNQCRRRWKVLLPHEVPLLQAAQRMKKAVLMSNFVDREKERPSLGPEDFYFTGGSTCSTMENDKGKRKKRKSEEGPKQKRQRNTHSSKQTAVLKGQSKRTCSKMSVFGNPGPLPERNKKASVVESSDLILDLEQDRTDSICTEPVSPEEIPMLDNVPHSSLNITCSEGIVRTMDDNCLLPDSTTCNVTHELSEIMTNTNQTVDFVPDSVTHGTNQEASAKVTSQENAEKTDVHDLTQGTCSVNSPQSASDGNSSKETDFIFGEKLMKRTPPCLASGSQSVFNTNYSNEITRIADDDCLLLDWIFHNVATDRLSEIMEQSNVNRAILIEKKKRAASKIQENGDCTKQASTIPSNTTA